MHGQIKILLPALYILTVKTTFVLFLLKRIQLQISFRSN